jgi:aryl-alcohol dehydrogenase-like predicted oxidoreductase
MLRSIAGHLQAVPCADASEAALDLATGTPLSVSDLMMGCAFVHSKRGEQAADDAQGKATVAAAIAAGIRDFDTA